ncbi:MAG: ATP-dependent helicase [Eubacteriales bacterium]|nr:ATP-dependent helicase [Eubacteriales bacterium]
MKYFDYLENTKGIYLNNEQKKAVSHGDGAGLVLSTAGSGKTTVITSRAGRLIYDGELGNNRILTITFSKLAAREMKARFNDLFPETDNRQIHFSTIHAFSYRVVRDYYKITGKNINLLKSNYDVLKKIMARTYSNAGFYTVSPDEIENLSSKISYVKNLKLSIEEFKTADIGIKDFEEIYLTYEAYKKKNDMIDFDDMLVLCEMIMKNNKGISDRFKGFYKYIQLDEAQDTSRIQFDIINHISNGNIFMVGDDDQSIYSFRGSSPQIMLDFEKTYKNAIIYNLDINYRCDGNTIEAAKRFIRQNSQRYEKNIVSFKDKTEEVLIRSFLSRRQQAEYIVSKIKKNPEIQTAILYRYNISSVIAAEMLRKESIDFYIKDDGSKYFNSSVLRDIISFFSLALNPYDKESFLNIYYKCQTFFTKEMSMHVMKSKRNVYDSLLSFPQLDKLRRKNIKSFKFDMNHISKLSPEQALDYIRRDMGYEDYLSRMEKDGRITFSSMFLNVEITKEICRNSDGIIGFLSNLDYLKSLLKDSKEDSNNKIILSSIHSTKGLEFDRVFLIDNIFGEFPLTRKNQSADEYKRYLEEERRVFYVGMTRAVSTLEILYPELPSQFVEELNNTPKTQ